MGNKRKTSRSPVELKNNFKIKKKEPPKNSTTNLPNDVSPDMSELSNQGNSDMKDPSGIISDDCLSVTSPTEDRNESTQRETNTTENNSMNNQIAEVVTNVTKKLFVSSLDPNTLLATLNPILIKKCIEKIAGRVT